MVELEVKLSILLPHWLQWFHVNRAAFAENIRKKAQMLSSRVRAYACVYAPVSFSKSTVILIKILLPA